MAGEDISVRTTVVNNSGQVIKTTSVALEQVAGLAVVIVVWLGCVVVVWLDGVVVVV